MLSQYQGKTQLLSRQEFQKTPFLSVRILLTILVYSIKATFILNKTLAPQLEPYRIMTELEFEIMSLSENNNPGTKALESRELYHVVANCRIVIAQIIFIISASGRAGLLVKLLHLPTPLDEQSL